MTADYNGCKFNVLWSQDDQAYIGTCDRFPSLSWISETPEKALEGIKSTTKTIISEIRGDYDIPGTVDFNINKNVTVVLTEDGKSILKKAYGDLYDVDKPVEIQLWTLMSVFGPHMHNGAVSFFENNRIFFGVKNFKTDRKS